MENSILKIKKNDNEFCSPLLFPDKKEENYEETLSLCDDYGKGFSKQIETRHGIRLIITNWEIEHNKKIEVNETLSALEFCFCLSGNLSCRINELKEEILFNRGKCNLSFFPEPNGTMNYKNVEPAVFVAIMIDIPVFYSIVRTEIDIVPVDLMEIINGKNKFLFIENNITAPMLMVIHQILKCEFTGRLKQLYLDSKVIELIVIYLDLLKKESKSHKKRKSLGSADMDKIYHAKEILVGRMQNPPSLVELAREVGLNDFKLKIGFRELFGTTVFGYLHQHRMECARLMFEDSDNNVAEVSAYVGYANPSHFASAFKKQFGINPGVFLSERKKKKLYC